MAGFPPSDSELETVRVELQRPRAECSTRVVLAPAERGSDSS